MGIIFLALYFYVRRSKRVNLMKRSGFTFDHETESFKICDKTDEVVKTRNLFMISVFAELSLPSHFVLNKMVLLDFAQGSRFSSLTV